MRGRIFVGTSVLGAGGGGGRVQVFWTFWGGRARGQIWEFLGLSGLGGGAEFFGDLGSMGGAASTSRRYRSASAVV